MLRGGVKVKIAVIADVHGNSFALEKVLEDIKKRACDEFIFLGDLVCKGPDPSSVLQMIADIKPACWIKGNTDMWFEEITEEWEPTTERERELLKYYLFAKKRISDTDMKFFESLPIEQPLHFNGTDILCVHGSPGSVVKGIGHNTTRDDLELMVEGVQQSIILSGHTHVPFIIDVKGKSIFNVGSVGLSSDGSNLASYGLVDILVGSAPRFEIIRLSYPISESVRFAKIQNFPNYELYEQALVNGSQF